MRVFFSNLGCKLNQAEVERMTRRFLAAGHSLAPSLEAADLHVVNSCTVTSEAARDSRKTARRGARSNGSLRTVLTGCYASVDPAEAARVAGVDLVVTNDRKEDLLELVHVAFPDAVPADASPEPYHLPLELGHVRALVKVEDGCNMRCAFCIIPTTRGRQRSRPLEEVVAETRALAALGYQEIVITGVQISEYRDGENRLYELVRALLEQTEVPRLRVTSIAPWKFDGRLLGLFADRRLCRHLHLSLQSGSSATLRRMRRPYTAEQYAELIATIRAAIPGVAVTTDVIVGFPGETPAEFEESLSFVRTLGFARPHVFTYSPRLGTEAAGLPEQVPPQEKKARAAAMLEIAETSEHAFWRQNLGERLEVVWEHPRGGRQVGLSDNYVRVLAESEEPLTGRRGWAELCEIGEGGVLARPVAAQM